MEWKPTIESVKVSSGPTMPAFLNASGYLSSFSSSSATSCTTSSRRVCDPPSQQPMLPLRSQTMTISRSWAGAERMDSLGSARGTEIRTRATHSSGPVAAHESTLAVTPSDLRLIEPRASSGKSSSSPSPSLVKRKRMHGGWREGVVKDSSYVSPSAGANGRTHQVGSPRRSASRAAAAREGRSRRIVRWDPLIRSVNGVGPASSWGGGFTAKS